MNMNWWIFYQLFSVMNIMIKLVVVVVVLFG